MAWRPSKSCSGGRGFEKRCTQGGAWCCSSNGLYSLVRRRGMEKKGKGERRRVSWPRAQGKALRGLCGGHNYFSNAVPHETTKLLMLNVPRRRSLYVLSSLLLVRQPSWIVGRTLLPTEISLFGWKTASAKPKALSG